MRSLLLALGLLLCAVPALAAPALVQEHAAFCATASTCDSALVSNPAVGSIIVIFCADDNGASTFTVGNTTYNGATKVPDFTTGVLSVTNFYAALTTHAPMVAAVKDGICNTGAAVSLISTEIAEVSGAVYVTAGHSACGVDSCTASISHSAMSAGHWAIALGINASSFMTTPWGCGAGWAASGTNDVCTGTDVTGGNNYTLTGQPGYGAAVMFQEFSTAAAAATGCGPYPYPCRFQPAFMDLWLMWPGRIDHYSA